MTVLGFQLVTTLIGASVLSKILSYFSFTRYVYNGLTHFNVPSDKQLLEACGNYNLRTKSKKRRTDGTYTMASNSSSSEVFYFPRAVSVQLQSSKVLLMNTATVPMYSHFQWLLDFTVCAMSIYAVTEVTYHIILPWIGSSQPVSIPSSANDKVTLASMFSFNTRLNLSLVWLSLTLWFAVRTLLSMTSIYFRSSTPNASPPSTTNNNVRECFLVLSSGFFFLIVSGVCLALDGRYFEFGLQTAYTNLTITLDGSSNVPFISWGAFHALLAFIAAFIGALFIYPGMKFGKLYLDSTKLHPVAVHRRLWFHLTFISPLIPILLWLKPLTDHINRSLVALSFRPFVSHQPTLLLFVIFASELFSTRLHCFRLFTCACVVFLRILTTRWNLQIYLNSAQDKLDQFSREPGRTSNREVQRLVASIFHCLNLVALQWIAPTILFMVTICLYKNSAGLSWLPMAVPPALPTPTPNPILHDDSIPSPTGDSWFSLLTQARLAFRHSTDDLSLRGIAVAQSILGFLTWWCLVALQSVSMIGLAYHRFTAY